MSRCAENQFSIGQCATLAVMLEVTAPKPGNVHRGADFDNMTYPDMLVGAVAIGPAMDAAVGTPLGETVLCAARATRAAVGVNTNLGTILLIAPLAAVPRNEPLPAGVRAVLKNLTPTDAANVYEAIRHASAGGLGQVDEADVHGPAPDDLVAAMRLARERDTIARQYATEFADLFNLVVPELTAALESRPSLMDAIVYAYLRIMSRCPDSLIGRKAGNDVMSDATRRAEKVLMILADHGDEAFYAALADFDFWLRADGRRRNPGTTADLIAAGLFILLRDGIIKAPLMSRQ